MGDVQLREFLKVTSLIIISIWLRLQFITRDTFIDEAFSYFFSKKPIEFIISGNDTHPPLYYLILKPFAHWLGNDIVALRMTSIAIWILFAIAFYCFVRQRFNKTIALYALTFATLSPTLIYYSTELRMYILLLLFFTINLIAYFNLLDKPNAKNTIIYAITATLMLYTHLFAALPLLIEALYGLTKKNAQKWLFWAFCGISLAFLPQLILTSITYANNPTFHYKTPTFLSLISTYSYMFTPPTYAVVCFALIIIFAIVFCKDFNVTPPFHTKHYLFLYAFLLMPIPIFILAQWTGIYHHRLFLTMIPPIYLLLSIIAYRIKQKCGCKASHTAFIALFILATMVNIMYAQRFYDYQSYHNFKIIDKSNVPIVHPYPITYLPYEMHYENTNRTNLLFTQPDFTFCSAVINPEDVITKYPTKPYIYMNFSEQNGKSTPIFLS